MIRKILATTFLFTCTSVLANNLTVEEDRIVKIEQKQPELLTVFSSEIKSFENQWQASANYLQAKNLLTLYSNQLWLNAKKQIKSSRSMDDRPLYWARLLSSKVVRTVKPNFNLTSPEMAVLLNILEQGSRGRAELEFTQNTQKKILLTGFDPFLLDRNINQSNPSGVAALLLDNKVIEYKGITAEINTVMVPVRYKDFDEGTIETLLAPYFALNNVDMIVTVSMGRKEFDLERFPGKRRSVTAPDNANILSGGTKLAPIVPKLHARQLSGNEFITFSLPVAQMATAKGRYKMNDNNKVTTIEKGTFNPTTIEDLKGQTAVSGSGGGYLSNEISYRSLRLRNELNSSIPTGHIHTPRIQQFEPEIEAKIIKQIQAMLEKSLTEI